MINNVISDLMRNEESNRKKMRWNRNQVYVYNNPNQTMLQTTF